MQTRILIILSREDLFTEANGKPLCELGWADFKGTTMDLFATADAVVIKDGENSRIMKDRRGKYAHLIKDIEGLVMTDDLRLA